MKSIIKPILYILFIFCVGACKKTNKRKISNYWNVSNYTEEYTYDYTYDSGTSGLYNSIYIINDNEFSQTISETSNSQTNVTNKKGSIEEYFYKIDKNGTYSITKTFSELLQGTIHYKKTRTQKGQWTFLKKNKTGDFKKNELIGFNPTETNTTEIDSLGNVTSRNSSSEITEYNAIEIYRIEESTNKLLRISKVNEGESGKNGMSETKTFHKIEITLIKDDN